MQLLEFPFLSIQRSTQGKIPDLPFVRVKERILGKKYNLSIAFVGRTESSRLHLEYSKKHGPANTLAFPLSHNEGEIVMSLETIRRFASNYKFTYSEFIVYLLIHSMVHLKGYEHSDEMETLEQKYRKEFNLPPIQT